MNSRRKPRKQLFLKRPIRYLLFLLLLTSACSSLYLLITSYNKQSKAKGDLLYSYKGNIDVDYKVNLYENSFVDETVLPSGGQYISDLVRNIDAEFTYNYSASKMLYLKYTYDIKATVYGEYNIEDEQEKVLTKEYIILDKKNEVISDTTSFSIKEPLTIDYRFYNDVITSFKQELKLPVNSYVNVTFTVNILGTVDGETIKDTKVKTLSIPLNEQAFKISILDNNDDKKDFKVDIRQNIPKVDTFDKEKLLDGIILAVFTIIVFLMSYKAMFGIRKKNNFNIKLKRILREYGDIIVQIVSPINDSTYDVVEVKGFSEMIDLEEELRTPINFYETIYGYEGEFVLVNNNILYKYILDNDDKKIE